MSNPPQIVVHGDVAIDRLSVPVPPLGTHCSTAANWHAYPGTRELVLPGGAMMLAELVAGAVGECADVHGPRLDELDKLSTEEYVHSYARLARFPRSTDPSERGESVYRIRKNCGFSGPADGRAVIPPLAADPADAELVVLDDVGNGFRDQPGCWPAALTEGEPLVILKMNTRLAHGALWEHLCARHANRLIVVVGVSDLRHEGARISRRLSWERTVSDVARELEKPPLARLKDCACLVVRFGVEGAIVWTRQGPFAGMWLFYDPDLQEESFADAHEGGMLGNTNAFVAGVAETLLEHKLSGVMRGVQHGLISSRRLYENGFGSKLESIALPGPELFAGLAEHGSRPSGIHVPRRATEAADSWSILHEIAPLGLVGPSTEYVLTGHNRILDRAPQARFGKLVTADRDEIEGYRAVQNLIREYVGRPAIERPLCIATFGPPGSGKSFGIMQVASSASPGTPIEKLDFNLSQFDSPDDLAAAFHRVRDVALDGRLPIAFFDEFDSNFHGRLGWLKHFLVPMQEGAFREGETMHPIGRAVFVFAGGTSRSFAEFSSADDVNGPEDVEFVKAKGPDFASRLRGFVDLKGINPLGDEELHVVRRAIILRVLLKNEFGEFLDAEGRLKADSSVIRAFLTVPEYRHGVRSMQAILEMSLLSGNRQIEQSALPSPQQLALHTDAAELEGALAQNRRLEFVREELAKGLHEQYRISQRAMPEPKEDSDPAMADWDQLGEKLKESNRRQADQIPAKLKTVGCTLRSAEPGKVAPPSPPFTAETQEDKQALEMLAEMEHARWNRERFVQGWCYGSARDTDRCISPHLVAWSKLSNEVKEYDRGAIRAIPKLLASVGFEIVRSESVQPPAAQRQPFGLSVKAAIRDQAGRVLLIRRSPESAHWPGKWDLVGGKVDPGEDPADTLLREAREETGLEIAAGDLIGANEFVVGDTRVVQLTFWADHLSGEMVVNDEHSESRWVDLTQLAEMDLADAIRDALAPVVRGDAAS
jgi:mutator protein MutT